MERHFHKDLEELKQEIFKMGALVEEMIAKAVTSLFKRDRNLAKQVFEDEKTINQLEIRIDEKGHGLLALDQPMAADMRMITAILKMNTDLERMGDHAINIAERALILCDEPPFETDLSLAEMADVTRKMLKDALISFIKGDTELARDVLKRDDLVDDFNDRLYAKVQSLMEKDPLIVKTGMKLVRISHDLERIADLANNIAEDAVYMKQGKEVRHRIELES